MGRLVFVVIASVGALACASPPEAQPEASAQDDLTLRQNTTWTIARGAPATRRVVAFGDSIFAGYHGSIFTVARRAAPYVAAEYLAEEWQANVEVFRRTTSGALARDIYQKKVQGDRAYMQDPSTRAVFLDMCGNDYLEARRALEGSSGACDLQGLDDALAECVTYTDLAMQAIAAAATTASAFAVPTLFYPGFDADAAPLGCSDPETGAQVTARDVLLPRIARSNYRVCARAREHGFGCADTFAEFMGADDDGGVEALRIDANESEDDYVRRITVTQRSAVHDATTHRTGDGATIDYLQSDGTHPTYYGDTLTGWVSGSSPPDFDDGQIVDGKNPDWDRFGHERMGHALARAALGR
jgi:hypothetical protein